MIRIQPVLQPVHTEQYKKGGKVKAKAKGKAKAVATATANPTVHVHVTRRQANRRPTAPQRSYTQAPPVNSYVNVSGGDFGMENQLMRMFQQLQSAPVKSTVPLRNQGMQTSAVDVELPEQVHNIQNIRHPVLAGARSPQEIRREDPSRAIRHDLSMNAGRLEQLARASALSHASQYPSSVDSGNPFDARSIPFSHHSYGDEWNTQGRAINETASSAYQDYEDFSYPAEPAMSEPSAFGLPSVPASMPVGSVPFAPAVNELHRENQIHNEKYEQDRMRRAERRVAVLGHQVKDQEQKEGKEEQEVPESSVEEATENRNRALSQHRRYLGLQKNENLRSQVLKLGITIGKGPANNNKGNYIKLLMKHAEDMYDEYGVV